MGSNFSSDDSDNDDELHARARRTGRKLIMMPESPDLYDQKVMYDQQVMIGGVRNFPLACKQGMEDPDSQDDLETYFIREGVYGTPTLPQPSTNAIVDAIQSCKTVTMDMNGRRMTISVKDGATCGDALEQYARHNMMDNKRRRLGDPNAPVALECASQYRALNDDGGCVTCPVCATAAPFSSAPPGVTYIPTRALT